MSNNPSNSTAQPKPQLGVKKLQTLNSQYVKRAQTMNTAVIADEDDSIVDLDYDINLTKIDYEKMKLVVKERHARKPDDKNYTCEDVCYNVDSGSHYCLKSSAKSDLSKFGVGIVLYFKFLKHLIFFFSLFTALSIPAFIFYTGSFSAYNLNNTTKSLNYIDLLTATTVGAVGFGASSCGISKYPSSAATPDQTTMRFECPTGKIASINNIVYGLVKTGTTCSLIDEGDLNVACNNYDTTVLSSTFTNCVGQSSCTITTPSGIFKASGSDSACDPLYSTQNVYIKVTCSTTTLKIFTDYTIEKSTVAFVVASLDAAIIVFFLLMIHTLKFAQKSAARNIEKKAYSASSYTVEIRNLPQEFGAEDLAAKLWAFLDQKLGEKALGGGHKVVDIQIVLPNKLIESSKNLGEVIHNKNTYIREFMQLYVPDYTKHEIDFKGLQQVMTSLKQSNPVKAKEAEPLFKKIRDLVLRKEKLIMEIRALKTAKKVRIVSAFVTFSSIPARNRILDAFISSPIHRIARVLCSCCYEKDVSFYGKILRARTPADPGSILWENLGEPGSSVFMRRSFSLLLTIMLWILSAVILIASTYYKNYFKQKYPTVDCGDKNPTSAQAAADFALGEYQKGYLECYCQADLVDRLNEVFPTANNETLCLTWFQNKLVASAVTFAVVFIVLIINYFIQFVFQGLSKFEKHSTLNKQLATRVLKTFVAQFLNTGVMILIVNAKIDISFWQGQFRDLPPTWYEHVGATLLSTMCINILTVPTIKAIFVLFKKIARCYDRRCGTDERITRKKVQTKYEDLYTGPEFIIDFRYSQILTLTFVCFLYSGGMPLLYLTSLLQLAITYFFDKFFLLRVSRLPKNYDENLEQVVRPTMYVALVAHLMFAIFMFGNNDVFGQVVSTFSSVTDSVSSITNQISTRTEDIPTKFFRRAVQDYNFILFILLIVFLAIFVVKGLLLGFLQRTVFALFMKDGQASNKLKAGPKNQVAPENLPNYTFFHVLKTEDLATLIRLTKVTIKGTQNQDLINLLKAKLALLKQEYLIKKQEDAGTPAKINFIGFYTYDVRLQPTYKSQFAIEEMLDDEDLN